MSKYIAGVKSFVADENGVTAIEYGLIAALMGVALVAVFAILKTDLEAAFNKIGDILNKA